MLISKFFKYKTQWLLGFVLLFLIQLQAQTNLVPNYSFENYTFCPTYSNAPPPPPWYIATNQSNYAYLNGCTSDMRISVPYSTWSRGYLVYQPAKSGQAYIIFDAMSIFGSDLRAYFQIKLYDSLIKNKKIYTEFYINKVKGYKYSSNNIGLWFTPNAVFADTSGGNFAPVLPANPQILNYGNPIVSDTINWVKISGVYTALGGEQYITIGNFKNDANTNYKVTEPSAFRNGAGYYLDDVSVIPLDSFCLKADAGADSTITAGDSVFIGSYTNGIDTIKWYNQAGQVIDSIAPGFWVKPTSTITYYVEQIVNGCFTRDTINVTVKPLPLNFISFTVIPRNEESVQLNWHTANEINVSHYQIQRSTNATDFATIGTLSAKNFASNQYSFTDKFSIPLLGGVRGGLMFYRIVGIDKDGKKTYSIIKSLNIQNARLDIKLYPNPVTDVLFIELQNLKNYTITDITGKVIIDQKSNGMGIENIEVSKLHNGVYFIKLIQKDNTIITQKFVKW